MGPKAAGRKEKLAAKAAQLEAKRREQEEKEELERQEQERLLKLEREREEKRMREEKEILEKSIRDEVLQDTCDYFHDMKEKNFYHLQQMRKKQEWDRFIACDRLPYPNDIPSMNTYLFTWHKTDDTIKMETILEKNEIILKLLNLLEDYIEEPLDATERTLSNWKEVRENYRKELRHKVDLGCFYLIRDVERRFNKINYWESEYEKKSDNIRLWMWVWMLKTVTSSITRASPSKNMGAVSVKLPKSFTKSLLILRVIHTTYDHYSDQSRTWEEPQNPIDHDIYDETTMWHHIKIDIITDNFQSLYEAEDIPCWFEIPEEFSDPQETSEFHESDEPVGKEFTNGRREEIATSINEKQLKIPTEKYKADNQKEEINLKHKTDYSEENTCTEEDLEQPTTTKSKQVYVGTLPIPGKPEMYRITSDGDIDIIRTKGEVKIELEEEEWGKGTEFEDWINLRQPVEIEDEMEIFDILTNNANLNEENGKSKPKIRTLGELIREVPARRGGLAALNLPLDVRNSLSEVLGIPIVSEKKKATEYHYEEETVFKSLSAHIDEARASYMEAYKKQLRVHLGEFELNLRKYVILGGIYHIDLIKQVPQPHKHKDGTVVQINYGAYNIRKEEFYFKYIPPMITEEEENEDEEEKAPVDDDIDKLICVDIQVPDTVLWFETPAPYLWESDKKIWSSENLYDIRFNEEKQILSFRIGKTSPIGIASFRYYNLPYQTWEIRPASDWKESRNIIFSLTASTVIAEYLVDADKVSLTTIQNATSGALDSILGIPFPPNQLIRRMREAGLDLFPGWDGFLYVEGNSAKKKVLEEHVYLCMAMFASSYQFTWSRWNMPAGPDRIVFQLRECLKPKDLGGYHMLLTTCDRAALVNCTEVSPSFVDQPASDIGFQPDLFNLLHATASDKAIMRTKKTDPEIVFTLYYLLLQTKMFSFS